MFTTDSKVNVPANFTSDQVGKRDFFRAKTFLGIQKLQKEFSIHTTIYWYKFNDVKVKNR